MAEYKDITPFIRDLTAMKQAYDAIGLDGMIRALNDAPAADVAPVVRCEDCRWWNHAGCAIRIVDDTDKPQANDFCSFGERRSE